MFGANLTNIGFVVLRLELENLNNLYFLHIFI